MSTLKKILALTLALAMVLSLNVFAAFNDQATIDEDCVTAVEMMNTLGVIKGDNNGNFNPEKTITRAEAATMIYRLNNKGSDNAKIWEASAGFMDTQYHWAKGYVNYGVAYEIIAGVSANVFNPEAAVKGVDLAKMLLTSLNYKSSVEGYTGPNYATNVMIDAFAAGLLEGMDDVNMAAPIERQWAAVMFNNALDCYMAKYADGELEMTTNTLGAVKFGFTTVTGILEAIESVTINGTAVATGYSTVNDNPASETTTDYNYKFVADKDLLGQEVEVVYNKESKKVYGINATGNSVLAKAPICDVTYASSKLTVGTVSATITTGAKEFINGTNSTFGLTGTAVTSATNVKDIVDGTAINSTATLKAIDQTGNGSFDLFIIDDKAFYGVAAVDSDGDYTLPGITEIDAEDLADKVNGTIADDDFVKVVANVWTGKYDVEKVTANVAKLMNRVNGYKLGSTSFKVAAEAVNNAASEAPAAYLDSGALGRDVEYYTDGKFIVMATAYVESTTVSELPTVVMLTAKGSATDAYQAYTYYVKVLGLDGKVTEYEFYKTDAATTTSAWGDGGANMVAGNLYTVTVNSDGTAYLTAFGSASTLPTGYTWQGEKSLAADTKIEKNLLDSKKIASDLTVFTVDGTTYGVAKVSALTKYVGKYEGVVYAPTGKLPSIELAKITLGTTVPGTASDLAYALVTDVYEEFNPDANSGAGATEKKADVIYTDGTAGTLIFETENTTTSGATETAPTDGKIYSFTTTEGVTTFTNPANNIVKTGALTVVDGNYVTIGSIQLADAKVVVVVKKGSGDAAVSTLDKALIDDYTTAVQYLVDKDGNITFMYAVQTAVSAS